MVAVAGDDDDARERYKVAARTLAALLTEED